MTTAPADPWVRLDRPASGSGFSALRVDATHPRDFFWAVDSAGACTLLLQHGAGSETPRLPRLKGVLVSSMPTPSPSVRLLAFRLLDPSHRDVFHRLCLDVVESTRASETERAAVDQAVARTWRWHHLLRGGSASLLSAEEQQGLIGELLTLGMLIEHGLPADAVLTAWCGPLNGSLDFDFGQSAIEVKTLRGASATSVQISNEHQLDSSGHRHLFLVTARLDRASAPADDGFTVTELVERTRDLVALADGSALSQFDDLIQATGFRWDDDYAEFRWLDLGLDAFQVSDDFPRIEFRELRPWVSEVGYAIGFQGCQSYRLEAAAMVATIKGADVDAER